MRTKKTKGKYIDPEGFYVARRRAGLNQHEAANMLDVTVDTIRNWEAAKSPIPYAAFKVMRMYGGYMLSGEKWEGWTITPSKLYSPEGRSFEAHELQYISNYFMMARLFLKEREKPKTQPQTLASSTAAREAASTVSPAFALPRLKAPLGEAGTLTVCGAALLRASDDAVPRLLGEQEKAKGGDELPVFKFGTFASYRTVANQEQYAEVQ